MKVYSVIGTILNEHGEPMTLCFRGLPPPLWTPHAGEGKVFERFIDANAIAHLYGGKAIEWEIPDPPESS